MYQSEILENNNFDHQLINSFTVSTKTNFTLSKQTQLIEPDTLIVLGLMQNMFDFSSLACAYIRPTVMAAGKAGGTTIVIRSKASSVMSDQLFPLSTYKKNTWIYIMSNLLFTIIERIYKNYLTNNSVQNSHSCNYC